MTQSVLLRLARALETFTYDPSKTFRGWLRLITTHALSDFFTDRKRRPGTGVGDHVLEELEPLQARDDLMDRLDQEFTLALVSQACAVVRARVEPHTWEAFVATAYDGLSGDRPYDFTTRRRSASYLEELIN